jgi:hypothetical protein
MLSSFTLAQFFAADLILQKNFEKSDRVMVRIPKNPKSEKVE